jgi:hypothetical protein
MTERWLPTRDAQARARRDCSQAAPARPFGTAGALRAPASGAACAAPSNSLDHLSGVRIVPTNSRGCRSIVGKPGENFARPEGLLGACAPRPFGVALRALAATAWRRRTLLFHGRGFESLAHVERPNLLARLMLRLPFLMDR